jgi:hypothetical protein
VAYDKDWVKNNPDVFKISSVHARSEGFKNAELSTLAIIERKN